jgi:peptidyl-prolyl cis-trans isomerase A (cyclophilin A)
MLHKPQLPMIKTVTFITCIFLFSFITARGQDLQIEMKTELGSIKLELYPDKAPITCENFIKYISNSKFDSSFFYRVVRMDNQPNSEVKIEVIQGGLGFNTTVSAFQPIVHETTKETGILHKSGVLSMARSAPGTASSEFFICIGDQAELDFGGKRNPDGQGFAAFGKVLEGMDVVKEIQQLKDESQMLVDKVVIHSIRIIE